jgi:hypothetical protein
MNLNKDINKDIKKDINIKKYLFENLTEDDDISIEFIERNCKNDKTFYKFIKICMKYKIYLFHKINDSYSLRNTKSLIRLITIKKSEITLELGKMILKLHNFDKYLETSTSDNFSDVYDTKNKIDQLYAEYNRNYRYLDELIKLLTDRFSDEILINFISKEFSLANNINNINNIIEEYSN